MYVPAVRNIYVYIMKPISRLSTQTGTRTVSSKSLSGVVGEGIGDADHVYVQAVSNNYVMKPISRLSTQTGTRTVSSESLI